MALAGRSRTPVLVGEVKWARRQTASRLVRQVRAKALRLPGVGDVDDLRVAVYAREQLDDVPADVVAMTAHDIFAVES